MLRIWESCLENTKNIIFCRELLVIWRPPNLYPPYILCIQYSTISWSAQWVGIIHNGNCIWNGRTATNTVGMFFKKIGVRHWLLYRVMRVISVQKLRINQPPPQNDIYSLLLTLPTSSSKKHLANCSLFIRGLMSAPIHCEFGLSFILFVSSGLSSIP